MFAYNFVFLLLTDGNFHLSKQKQPLAMSRQPFDYGFFCLNLSAHQTLEHNHISKFIEWPKTAATTTTTFIWHTIMMQTMHGKANRPKRRRKYA